MCQTQVPNAVGEVRTQFKCLVLLLGAIWSNCTLLNGLE
jgi:hypothetical protein